MHIALEMSVFFKLLNVEKISVHTLCRLDLLRTCRYDRIIPYGFHFVNLQSLASHRPTYEIIDATSLTGYFSVKRNVETLIRNIASDIRARHRRNLLKLKRTLD